MKTVLRVERVTVRGDRWDTLTLGSFGLGTWTSAAVGMVYAVGRMRPSTGELWWLEGASDVVEAHEATLDRLLAWYHDPVMRPRTADDELEFAVEPVVS